MHFGSSPDAVRLHEFAGGGSAVGSNTGTVGIFLKWCTGGTTY